ncbi:DUF3784 domain-containing protein [Mesobacillus zeae]|uniref:DUF3784 domain-containing protein n=1 Tax=Mesobacillus zeae TaxID=1917180 RepID=A0A398B641_9BACI|nr:DUF3784 domain-containing protein [Mesobacillus zeae]RID84278.1 DUF3784 domain-containing protein [Mesobacillus zeae]
MNGPIIFIGLFIVLGIIFSNGKGSFLIAGYNTMHKKEKEKYDTVSLCKFMGKAMFSIAFSMAFWVLSDAFKIKWLFYVGLVLFLCTIVFIIIYTNSGNRFKK